jgi:hypothetical protein
MWVTTRGLRKLASRVFPTGFLRFFSNGFPDETYLEWERNYKADAHDRWDEELGRRVFGGLLTTHQFTDPSGMRVA